MHIGLRRRRRVVVAAVLLAVPATLAVVTHRSSASPERTAGHGPSSSAATATPVTAASSQPASTDDVTDTSASASPPVAAATAGWSGGSNARTDRSAAGARASALLYVSAVQSQAVYLGAPADRAVLAGWLASSASPIDLDRALRELAEARDVLTKGNGPVWWVVSPLAVRVVTASDSRVRVAVWLVRVIASGANSGPGVVPAVSWTTSTVDLVWTDTRGWSVESVSDVPGPVPMAQSTAQPATSAEFVARLDGFGLVKEHS